MTDAVARVFRNAAISTLILAADARAEQAWDTQLSREWAVFAQEFCLRSKSADTTMDTSEVGQTYVAWQTVAAGACCLGGHTAVQEEIVRPSHSANAAPQTSIHVPSVLSLVSVSEEWSFWQIVALAMAAETNLRSDAVAFASLTAHGQDIPEHVLNRLRGNQIDCVDYGRLHNVGRVLAARAAEGTSETPDRSTP